jgi:DNA (cytosine-5)-methyltransferase 1
LTGGFDLGFERAGMTCAWQSEIQPNCREVLQHHWPEVTLHGDIQELKGAELSAAELICGGFPCQDVSLAGKRAGLAGERSGLWWEFHRILEEHRPNWAVIENVPGLLSSNRGLDFATIVFGLAQLGYGVAWRLLDAKHFGVPQRRRRLIIVGHLGDYRAVEVLFESESLSGNPPARGETRPQTAATLRSRSASRGVSIPGRGGEDDKNLTIAKTLTKGNRNDPTSEEFVSGPIAGGAYGTGRRSEDDPNLVIFNNGQGDPNFDEADVAFALDGQGHQGIAGTMTGAEAHNGNSNPISDNHVVGALQPVGGGPDDNDAQAGHIVGVSENLGVRRLTPTECERLQGFPDGFTEGHSDTQRYRMIGNAVAVPVAEWIARRIIEAIS